EYARCCERTIRPSCRADVHFPASRQRDGPSRYSAESFRALASRVAARVVLSAHSLELYFGVCSDAREEPWNGKTKRSGRSSKRWSATTAKAWSAPPRKIGT